MKGFKLYVTRRSSFLLRNTFPAKLGIQQIGFSTHWKLFVGGWLSVTRHFGFAVRVAGQNEVKS